jgi:hypothetical protein
MSGGCGKVKRIRMRSPPQLERRRAMLSPRVLITIGYTGAVAGLVSSVILALAHVFLVGVADLVATGGLVLALYVKACRKFESVNRPADEAFDSGYEIGFDKGWCEGRDAQRPKLIPHRSRNAVDRNVT